MSPEHAYPIPVDECYSVTLSLLKNPKAYGIDINKVVLAGDSAGKEFFRVILF